jgi:hypothetical protein
MLSPGDRPIKAEIERLQKAQRECTDRDTRQQIEEWIVEQKQKLAADGNSSCHICGEPCPAEDYVTDVQGHSMHKKCYRDSRISTHYQDLKFPFAHYRERKNATARALV